MRKFKALLLVVTFLFVSVTISHAQLVGGSAAANNSAVSYVHNDYTFFGLGGLDLVGGAAGLTASIAGISGGALLGGAAGAALGFGVSTIAGGALTGAALGHLAQPGFIAGALGAVVGLGFTAITGVIPGSRLLGAAAGWGLGTAIDLAVLRPELFSGIASLSTLTAFLGAGAGGALSRVAKIGVGAAAGYMIGANINLLGMAVGALVGALYGTVAPGIVTTGLGGVVGAVVGGTAGLAFAGPVRGAAIGVGLGNVADEFIQAGLTRGDNAPAKPVVSTVSDFM